MLKLNAVNLVKAEYAIANLKTEKTIKICNGYYSPVVEEGDYGAEAIILTHPKDLIGTGEMTKFVIIYYTEGYDKVIQQNYTFDSFRDKKGLDKEVTDFLCEKMKEAWEAYIATDDPQELNKIVEDMDILLTDYSTNERSGGCCNTMTITRTPKNFYSVPDDTYNAVCVKYRAFPEEETILISPANQIDYVTETSEYDYTDEICFNADRKIEAYVKIPEDKIVRVAKMTYEIDRDDNEKNDTLNLNVLTYDINQMKVRARGITIQIDFDKFPNAVKALKDLRDTIYGFWKLTLGASETIADDWDDGLVDMAIAFIKEEVPTDLGVSVSLRDYTDDIDSDYNDYAYHEFR